MQETNPNDYKDDQLIINYNDVCIYGRDLRLLTTRGAWLNDTILHYQLVRLQERYVHDKTILLLDPVVLSFFMHQCEDLDEFSEFWNGCNNGFKGTHRLVLPIVDTMSDDKNWYARSGTHWSLLILDIHASVLHGYHFDSIHQSGNYSCAQQVANKMQQLFHCMALHDISDNSPTLVPLKVTIQECAVPKQKNGYDCGLHVLIAAEMIVQQPNNFIIEPNMEHHFHRTIEDWTENHDISSIEQCCIYLRQRIAYDIFNSIAPKA